MLFDFFFLFALRFCLLLQGPGIVEFKGDAQCARASQDAGGCVDGHVIACYLI